MPAHSQKRFQEATEDESMQSNQNGDELTVECDQYEDGDSEEESHSSSNGGGGPNKDEYVMVKLAEIRKEVQCPICLGIIRKTRTVMECLHRFCRECIDKSMRMGNNECPACRTHCASRRSLRDDPKYDALIAVLYPDIDKFEEEELAFYEEERGCNQQIQASISQTLQRQSEALGRKQTTARAAAAAFVRRSLGSYRKLRGKRNYQAVEQGSDDEDDANGNDGPNYLSSSDEQCTEVKPKRPRRGARARFSQPSLTAASTDGCSQENDEQVNRESTGASAGLVGSSEMLVWGKGGMRSHNRHGGLSGSNGKHARNSRISKLKNWLQNSEEDNDELNFNLMLVSLDEQRIPSLQRPYLCCRPNLSVRHLCQYVATKTSKQADDVEILLVKELHSKVDFLTHASDSISISSIIDLCKDKLNVLEENETLVGVQAMCNYSNHGLLLAYRQKLGSVNVNG